MTAVPSEEKSKRVTRFDAPGINYKAKLIGLEDVTDPRGDKMCQVAMAKLKAAVVAMGEHKQRMVVNVSLEGIKLIDEKSENVLHTHPVHRISFISRDTSDSRAFGYVYNREDGVHQFCGIKTEKAAEPLVTCLKDLFQTVVELKKEKEKENAKNENAVTVVATEIKDKEKEEVEVEKSPVSTDLLGLEGSVAGVQKGVDQLNIFSAQDSSTAWLNNNLFQNVPTQNVANVQAAALHLPQAATIPGNPYLAQGMAAPPYQPSYPQQPFTSYNPAFPSQHPAGIAVVGAVGLHTAWPQTTGPPAANPQPSNPNWMSFDTSSNAFSGVPMQPISTHPPPSTDPFAPPAKFPDPFADLAVLPSQAAFQPGKKASKDDFIKEPPKPSLLDLSTQQQRQQPTVDLTTAVAGDPFAAVHVSPPRNGSPFGLNPFQQDIQNFHSTPYAPNPAQHTLDKSHAVYPSASSVFSDAQSTQLSGGVPPYPSPARPDLADLGSSQVSRPRPKSNAGSKAALVLPLTPKVKPNMLCTNPPKHMHDRTLLRSNIKNDAIECKTHPDNLPGSDVNQLNNPTQPLTCLQRSYSADNDAKSFDELWLLSAARGDEANSPEEGIWFMTSNNDLSGKTMDWEKRVQVTNLKYNAFDSYSEKQISTTTTGDCQNVAIGEICFSFENCSTSTENVTTCFEPDVFLNKKEDLMISDRDQSFLVPGGRNSGLSLIEQGNDTPANILQGSLLPTRSTSQKPTLASLARRSSARKTCSLQGLVTIREENDAHAIHPSLQPALSADGREDKHLLQTPSFLTKRNISKHEISAESCVPDAANDASGETYLKLNPFAGVDPFVTDSFALGDPFDNQNGRLVCKDACRFFDLLQVDSAPFCTRAVTVDCNTKQVC